MQRIPDPTKNQSLIDLDFPISPSLSPLTTRWAPNRSLEVGKWLTPGSSPWYVRSMFVFFLVNLCETTAVKKGYLENQLLLISINWKPLKPATVALKKVVLSYVFQVHTSPLRAPHDSAEPWGPTAPWSHWSAQNLGGLHSLQMGIRSIPSHSSHAMFLLRSSGYWM